MFEACKGTPFFVQCLHSFCNYLFGVLGFESDSMIAACLGGLSVDASAQFEYHFSWGDGNIAGFELEKFTFTAVGVDDHWYQVSSNLCLCVRTCTEKELHYCQRLVWYWLPCIFDLESRPTF